MGIDLSRFRDEAVSSIPIKGKTEGEDLDIRGRKIKFLEPIKYNGEIYRVDGDRLLHLDIIYKYREACGRCLEPFVGEGETTLTAKLVEKIDNAIEKEEENEDIIYYIDEELDLQEYVMNTVILALPMKPLCNEDCKGLCPRCGTNYNRTKCDCVIEEIDPRFEKLKNFFPNE